MRQTSELNHVLIYLLSRSQCHVVRKEERSTGYSVWHYRRRYLLVFKSYLVTNRHICATGIVLFFL